tara:strand:+ start:2204 stop:2758 length:555 start_codon:yes stop_codon:yes gene_type:complete
MIDQMSEKQRERYSDIISRQVTAEIMPVKSGDKFGILYNNYNTPFGDPDGLIVDFTPYIDFDEERNESYQTFERLSADSVDLVEIERDKDGCLDYDTYKDADIYSEYNQIAESHFDYLYECSPESLSEWVAEGKTLDQALDELEKYIDHDAVEIPGKKEPNKFVFSFPVKEHYKKIEKNERGQP